VIPSERFDYRLPAELIAQSPAERRDRSRLLVVDRSTRAISHRMFGELPGFLRPGDTLLRNNASVLPARLRGRRPTGGKVECLLLRSAGPAPGGGETWQCLVRPGRRLPAGAAFEAADGALAGVVTAVLEDGSALVRFAPRCGESVVQAANRAGEVPLPPYIERRDDSRREQDRERYQTVYADRGRQVAVAAPTAGLHFTHELLGEIRARGVLTADLTLHVGLGTFRPITAETIEAHRIHTEVYEIPADTQRALFPPLAGRRIAVGTTTVRSIEDFLADHGAPLGHAHLGESALFIHPPRVFKGVDALITNFHQPRSTLLCLVAAFLAPGSAEGIDWLMDIYAEAISTHYRFLSYGDAMLIL
jgi:S-adenosylmethionine:tRNA ribosyltransferase-isomerase